MTIEDAIIILDPETRREAMREIPVFERIDADQAARRLAVAALRAQAEKNTPLTPEELREMGGEPYWHVSLQAESAPPHYVILTDSVARCPQDYFYGKTWLAYRRKPEEEGSEEQ